MTRAGTAKSEARVARRTCVVSRTEHDRDELVRLVASPDGVVIVDYRAKLPGRGVWLLPDADTLAQLGRKRGLVEKALGATLDVERVIADLRACVEQAIQDGMSMAAAAGEIVYGRERLETGLTEGRLHLVAISQDASDRTTTALRAVGSQATFVQVPWSSDQMGARIGRGPVAAVAPSSARAATHLRRQLRRLSRLG